MKIIWFVLFFSFLTSAKDIDLSQYPFLKILNIAEDESYIEDAIISFKKVCKKNPQLIYNNDTQILDYAIQITSQKIQSPKISRELKNAMQDFLFRTLFDFYSFKLGNIGEGFFLLELRIALAHGLGNDGSIFEPFLENYKNLVVLKKRSYLKFLFPLFQEFLKEKGDFNVILSLLEKLDKSTDKLYPMNLGFFERITVKDTPSKRQISELLMQTLQFRLSDEIFSSEKIDPLFLSQRVRNILGTPEFKTIETMVSHVSVHDEKKCNYLFKFFSIFPNKSN